MQKVKGYVFIAERDGNNFLFGENISVPRDRNWCSLSMNNLTPYISLDRAEKGAKEYKQRANPNSPIKRISLAKLEMMIAESHEESENFRNEDNLIIIGYLDFGIIDFFGKVVEGKQRSNYGSYLMQNGLKPFRNNRKDNIFNLIEYNASEFVRQSGAKSAIAQFNLRKIIEVI